MPEDMARPLGERRREATALPAWIKPQLTKPVDKPPMGRSGCTNLNTMATRCMPGWTAARSGC